MSNKKTINCWRVFFTTCSQCEHAPRIDRCVSREMDGKKRTGDGLVFRIYRDFALVIGWWRK
jgi:hypothetical protein